MRFTPSVKTVKSSRSKIFLLITLILGYSLLSAQQLQGQENQESLNPGYVEVFEVSGLLDDVLASALENSIIDAQNNGANALILQMNSKQAVISNQRLVALGQAFLDSSIPIEVWVGPSGSTAQGKVAQLALLSDSLGVSIGSSIGKTGEYVFSSMELNSSYQEKIKILRSSTLQWNEAIEANLVQCDRVEIDELGKTLTEKEQLARCANPTLGDFLVNRDSFVSEVIQTDDGPRLSPLTKTKINRLNLIDQLMHTVASPPITYLLLISGLALLLFEFFSIGVGIAGVIGAISVALSAYGLTILPFRPWALLLIIFSMLAFAIDIQTVVPRVWTLIGQIMFTIGTIFLYYEVNVEMSWIPMSVGIIGVLVLMARGMPIMIRGRFATTQIDRR
jgi:membrane-bound serine protease (ClpP class)|tara:strand:+ start:7298 stop:8473 length:1176 start_codon:yes stop_codon:yes gene_type:complete